LPYLARTYNVQCISDAYWNSPFSSESEVSPGEPIALHALLDRLVGSHYLWDRVPVDSNRQPRISGERALPSGAAGDGPLVRLRSRQWFYDRPQEVPLRLIRQWRGLAEQYGALPLAAYLEIARSLNDGQLASLGDLLCQGVLPYELQDLSRVHSVRNALCLYANLSSRQQEALWQGRAITAAQMTPTQCELFAAASQEYSGGPSPQELLPLAGASLSLIAEPCIQVREQRPESTRYYREPAPVPAEPLAAMDTISPTARVVVTRHSVTRVRLRLQCGPVGRDLAFLTIALPP
jgi:hypothetical protein